MAAIYDIAGTTNHSFTIGEDGVTTYYGSIDPSENDIIGKVGDIFIQNKIEDDYEEGKFNNFGRVYIKMVVDGTPKWVFIKNYSFDNPIIKSTETSENSNNFEISLQSAKAPSSATSSTQSNDYEKNHDNFGVTRFGTNAENVASDISNYQTYSSTNLPTNFNTSGQKFMDKYIALTPKQIADNIKVEMKRAITVEGTLNSLNSPEFDNYKTDLVTAINHENTRAKGVEGTLSNLNTGLTQTNLVAAINSENTRAKGVEGTLTSLTTEDKSNLVAAINSEVSRATGAENGLQDQIDAIVSKSDVVDVVSCYNRGTDTSKTDIVHYNTSSLGDNDVIKVLIDETHNDATTYYRWDTDTSQFVYIGPEGSYYTKAEADDRFVNATDNVTETINGNKTFSGTTTISGSIGLGSNATATTQASNDSSTKVATTAWVNDQSNDVVHKSGTETVTGTKTFTQNILRTGEFGSGTTTAIKLSDTNNKGYTEIDAHYLNSKVYNRALAKNTTANKDAWLDICISDTGVGSLSVNSTNGATTWSNNDASNSKDSNSVAFVGWVNDPTKSTNVVHRDGTETITGAKTFTGSVDMTTMPNGTDLTVKTQTRGDSSTKAASTAFVADGLSLKVDKSTLPTISSGTNGQVLSNNGSAFVWKTVKDITTLSGLDDTTITSPTENQSLIYDSSSSKWVNGRQTTATISYW